MAALAALAVLACGAAEVAWPPYKPLAAAPGHFSSVGNHRFNVSVPAAEAAAAAVVVTAVWRRPDSAPLSKAVYITSSANSSAPIPCSFVGEPSADSATFTFAPVAGSTQYFIYYMPFTTCEYAGGACVYGAQTTYDRAGTAGSCEPGPKATAGTGTAALAASYQARAAFESFEPMEQPMSAAELEQFLGAWPSSSAAIVVAEARENVVKMKRMLPHRWAGLTPATASSFEAAVRPGEKFTFQLAVVNMLGAAPAPAPPRHPISQPFCVQQSSSLAFCQKNKEAVCPWYIKTGGDPNITVGWASDPGSTDPNAKCCRSAPASCIWYQSKAQCEAALRTVSCLPCKTSAPNFGCPAWGTPLAPPPPNVSAVTFSSLQPASGSGAPIPAPHCMNTQGSDFWGRNFTVTAVPVLNGVLPLWVAAAIPTTAAAGTYHGTARVVYKGLNTTVSIALTVSGAVLPNGGDDDIERGTRLHWFDSTLGIGGDTTPAPYTPVKLLLPPRLLGTAHTQQAAQQAGHTVELLGKRITVSPSGLPAAIWVTQDQAGAPPLAAPRSVLASPGMSFAVDGLELGAPQLALGRATKMSVAWTSTSRDGAGAGTVTVAGSLDCTGYVSINVTVRAHKAIADAGVTLRLPSNPDSAFFAMGLGRPGGLMDHWVGSAKGDSNGAWLQFDLGSEVELDGFRLYGAGDNVHDVQSSFLQAAAPGSTPASYVWQPEVAASFATRRGAKLPQDFYFPGTKARIWRWVATAVSPSINCPGESSCQAQLAEVEFHEAGAKKGVFMLNQGSANHSLVFLSSGDGTPQNEAWKAVDGDLSYADFSAGWDTTCPSRGCRPLPNPPKPAHPPPPPGTTKASWKWDHQNGNNGVWFGSTKAGVRLQLKGEDPLWWAGSPYDSGTSPEPPVSWSNGGSGGIDAFSNGTALAYSGPRAMAAGEEMSFVFSLMVTPVRPHNLASRFKERWAQLGGPGNYTALAESGVTVVNMHQGNEVNPWINYPYLTNTAMKFAADACHDNAMKFSVYNTMRELSDRCFEYYAMLSFGAKEELATLVPGNGGGADWLQEHIREGYLPAWSNPVPVSALNLSGVPNPDPAEGARLQDAGMRVKALTRWNNYYVAGLRQIQRDYGTDGICERSGAPVFRTAPCAPAPVSRLPSWHSSARDGFAPQICRFGRDRVRPGHDAEGAQDAGRLGHGGPPRRPRLRLQLAGYELHGALPLHQSPLVRRRLRLRYALPGLLAVRNRRL